MFLNNISLKCATLLRNPSINKGLCSSACPLDGLRVCDITRVLAGPYCTMMLGDLGAEVIKVERPGIGDDTRHFAPPYIGSESCYYMSVNRNKKSIAVNMKREEGQKIIHDIVRQSDVFIENFIPGKMKKLKLDYPTLKKINPRLIYCSITGFGARGIDAEMRKPGYDIIASAVGGLTHLTGPTDGEACRVGVAVTDIMCGLYAHGAILTALLQRQQTGVGVKIDTSLLQTQVAVMSHVASEYLNAGFTAERQGSSHRSIVPYQSFTCQDGQHIVVAVANDELFRKFCKACGLEDLLKDDKYKRNPDRVEHRKELVPLIAQHLKTKPRTYWQKVLDNVSVPCGPINNIKQVFENEQVEALGMIQNIEHPSVGAVKVSGPAVDYDGKAELRAPLHPPMLGEHTREVLSQLLNYDDSTIEYYLENRVVEQ